VTFKGKGVFDLDAAVGLLKQVEEGHALVKDRGKFTSVEARAKLLGLYEDAGKDLRERINGRK
jgi:hypothetical protein